jgi:hypothetical protein
MKIKLPKLHNQILLALVLGAVFGSIFNVNINRLELKSKKNGAVSTTTIDHWQKFSFILEGNKPDTLNYAADQQLEIITKFKELKRLNVVFL